MIVALGLVACVTITSITTAHASEFWDGVREASRDPIAERLAMAEAALAVGEVDEAGALARALLREAPEHAPAHIVRARVALAREDYAAATDAFRRAVSLERDILDEPVLVAQASGAAMRTGAFTEAASWLGRSVAGMTPSAFRNALYAQLGDAYLAGGDPPQARRAYDNSRDARGALTARAAVGLALALARLGDREGASEAATRAAGLGAAGNMLEALPIPEEERAARWALLREARNGARATDAELGIVEAPE